LLTVSEKVVRPSLLLPAFSPDVKTRLPLELHGLGFVLNDLVAV
jgi:hypothetical protein